MFVGLDISPMPREHSPASPNFGASTYVQTVWRVATKLGMW